MKKVIYIFGFLVLGLSLNSCFSTSDDEMDGVIAPAPPPVKYNVVKIEGLYSMKVPSFMTVTDQLQEDASLQYVNPFKEKYVLVLDEKIVDIMAFMEDYGIYDESKSKLDNYVTTRLSYFTEIGNTIISQTALKSEMINGRKAISTVVDIETPSIDENVTYYFTYIEGKDHYYMISSWTLFDRKDAFTEEVEAMTGSFKEL